MIAVDPRVVASLRAQLVRWRAALDGGAERIGWKIGLNIPEVQERLGLEEPVIGHLTSASRLESGGVYMAGRPAELRAEPEIALELGRDVEPGADADAAREALGAIAPAIELVDVGRPPADLESIVAENVFHRAFVLGTPRPAMPAEGVEASVSVNGELRGSAPSPDDFADVVRLVARLLGAAGERLQAGDRIIAGSLTAPVPVEPGDEVEADFGGLGRAAVSVA